MWSGCLAALAASGVWADPLVAAEVTLAGDLPVRLELTPL
jgi:hypothetical protein